MRLETTMLSTKMTRKGQVTIPAEIRKRLNLEEGDVLLVHEDGGRVVLESQLEELRRTSNRIASLMKNVPPLEPGEIRELAAKAIVQENLETLQQIERDQETTQSKALAG